MSINFLLGIGIGLTVLGIIFAIGAVVLAELGNNSVVSGDANATTVVTNAKEGLVNATSLLGVLGLIAVAGAVIVVGFGMFGKLGGTF